MTADERELLLLLGRLVATGEVLHPTPLTVDVILAKAQRISAAAAAPAKDNPTTEQERAKAEEELIRLYEMPLERAGKELYQQCNGVKANPWDWLVEPQRSAYVDAARHVLRAFKDAGGRSDGV